MIALTVANLFALRGTQRCFLLYMYTNDYTDYATDPTYYMITM